MSLNCYSVYKEFITSDFQGHGDVVGEELAGAEALGHGDVRAIDRGGELGDGVETDVALEGRGDPGADTHVTSRLNPLATTLHAAMEGGLQDDVIGLDDVEHVTFHLRVVDAYQLLVEGDGQG